ncbi:MAG: type II toxin-antitoxin system VapC family toxin [Verrucomicrobia bacterium]|nr:type II toxin-antitoxin system VapC family toxin [Verrucomicrobiota bacterium]
MERIALKYLLDTAPWINAVLLPTSIPNRILTLLASGEPKGLCAISLLEAAILYRLKRLELRSTLAQFFEAALAENLHLIELTPVIAIKTNELSDRFHGDPFDRTIVATAAVMGLTLITADRAILEAEQCAVEYYPFKPLRAQDR